MLVRVNAKGAKDFATELGEYNVISKKLRLWYSPMFLVNSEVDFTIKDFEIPEDCKKIELVDPAGYETLAVPLDVFKAAFVEGKGYVWNYEDWKKKYLKPF